MAEYARGSHTIHDIKYQMGKLLTPMYSCGVQIIVGTHSDHLLNGIRNIWDDGLLAGKFL
jgi:predicted ATPase